MLLVKSRVPTWLYPICLSWVFVCPQEWSGIQTWWRPWSCRTWCYAHCRPYMVQRHGRNHGELMPGKIIKYVFKIYHNDLTFSQLVLFIPTHFLFHFIFPKSESRKTPFPPIFFYSYSHSQNLAPFSGFASAHSASVSREDLVLDRAKGKVHPVTTIN